jgi:SET domain-containing protein
MRLVQSYGFAMIHIVQRRPVCLQILRPLVADVFEKRHRTAGHDDYQFRLESVVVDATTCGGIARYINHSCAPNCLVRPYSTDKERKDPKQSHLAIFAGRDIAEGEELCYDYKV